MMNKEEIEQILKHLKRLEERYLELKAKKSAYNDEEYYAHILLQYIEDLQQRIDKGIEYINDLSLDFYDYECEQLIVGKHMINELLEILGGKE